MAEDNYITKVCGVKIKDSETSSKVAAMAEQMNDVINDYDGHFEKTDGQISSLESSVASLTNKHELDIANVKQGLLDEQSAREDFDNNVLPSCFMGTDIDKVVLRRLHGDKDGYYADCFPVLNYTGKWPKWLDAYGEEQAYISDVYLDCAYIGDTGYDGARIYHISNVISCDYDVSSATESGVTTVTRRYWFKVAAWGGYNIFCLVLVDTTTSGAADQTHLMYFDRDWDWVAAGDSSANCDIGLAEYNSDNDCWVLTADQATKFNEYISALKDAYDASSASEIVPMRVTLGPTVSDGDTTEGNMTLTGVPSWNAGTK